MVIQGTKRRDGMEDTLGGCSTGSASQTGWHGASHVV